MEFHTEIQSAPQIVRDPQNSMSQMANVRRNCKTYEGYACILMLL